MKKTLKTIFAGIVLFSASTYAGDSAHLEIFNNTQTPIKHLSYRTFSAQSSIHGMNTGHNINSQVFSVDITASKETEGQANVELAEIDIKVCRLLVTGSASQDGKIHLEEIGTGDEHFNCMISKNNTDNVTVNIYSQG